MRKKRCVCGFMADVDEWNAKGVVMYCPECGAFDLSRDDLYEMGLQTRMMRVFLDRWRKRMKADAENPEIDDEAYRSACEMAVETVDEMFRGLEDADREWRDERAEEIDLFQWGQRWQRWKRWNERNGRDEDGGISREDSQGIGKDSGSVGGR